MTIENIKTDIEKNLEIDLSKKNRTRGYLYARAMYVELALRFTNKTYQQIASLVNISHCTIVHYKSHNFYAIYDDYRYKELRDELIKKYELIKAKKIQDNNVVKVSLSETIKQLEASLFALKEYHLSL